MALALLLECGDPPETLKDTNLSMQVKARLETLDSALPGSASRGKILRPSFGICGRFGEA